MRKTLDIKRKFKKKALITSKHEVKKAMDRNDATIYLEEETHYSNGESEFVYRIHIRDNFN